MNSKNDLVKCKFCEQHDDGGVDLLSTKADLGELGTLEAGITLWTYRINDYPSNLNIWMWRQYDKNNGEHIGNRVKLTIRYCPMCGRELKR